MFISSHLKGYQRQSSQNADSDAHMLLLLWRHLILNVSYKRDPHLGRVIAAEHITHKVRFDLHLNLVFGSVIGPGTREPDVPFLARPGAHHTGYLKTRAHLGPSRHLAARQSRREGCHQR